MFSIQNQQRLIASSLMLLLLFLLLATHGPATELISSDFRSSVLLTGPNQFSSTLVQQVTFRDSFGRTWSESTLLTQDPIFGGRDTLEAKLFERANKNK